MDHVDYIDDEVIEDRECDILVLAGYSSSITSENANDIKAKIIIEAAN